MILYAARLYYGFVYRTAIEVDVGRLIAALHSTFRNCDIINPIIVGASDEVDALYINLGDDTPEGVNVDTSAEDRIVGIGILNASRKIDLNTI